MLVIFFILAVATVFCLLAFSTNLFMTHYYLARRESNDRLVLSFGFVWFVLDVIAFVYNRLKQSLILQTNANRFLQIFFAIGILFTFIFLKKHIVLIATWIRVCSYVCHIYLPLLFCFANLYYTRDTFLVSRGKKS